MSDYPDFKLDSEYVKWSEATRHIAHMQEMSDIVELDPPFRPNPHIPGEVELYNTRNIFMYNVLYKHVLTSQGISIVRSHSGTRDGHAVFRDLRARYVNSSAALLVISSLRARISGARLTATYPGKYEEFVDKLVRLIADHQEMTPFASNLTEEQKIEQLHTSLGCVPELASVRSNLIINARNNVQCNYDDIVQMYKSLCAGPDALRASSSVSRSAQVHAIYESTEDEEHSADTLVDIDDDDVAYWVHATTTRANKARPVKRTPPTPSASTSDAHLLPTPVRKNPPNKPAAPVRPPRLTRAIFDSISKDGQRTWDLLSDVDKATILRYGTTLGDRFPRQAHVAESVPVIDNDLIFEEGTTNTLLVNELEQQPVPVSSGNLDRMFNRPGSN